MIDGRVEMAHWRPQRFGGRSARSIESAVIEPVWNGVRLLASVTDDAVRLRDADGHLLERPRIEVALLGAIHADSVVVDGYLTRDAAQSGVGIYSGPAPSVPTPGEMARQLVVGGRNRRAELVEALEARAQSSIAEDDEVVFVAVDLLLLDEEPLLNVPLLERKRLLDAVIVPSELVRIGIHVRPPVDSWLGTWRNLGFRLLAYKDPNGRYRPGEANDGWATAQIPKG